MTAWPGRGAAAPAGLAMAKSALTWIIPRWLWATKNNKGRPSSAHPPSTSAAGHSKSTAWPEGGAAPPAGPGVAELAAVSTALALSCWGQYKEVPECRCSQNPPRVAENEQCDQKVVRCHRPARGWPRWSRQGTGNRTVSQGEPGAPLSRNTPTMSGDG